MGVYIRDMQMPTRCIACRLNYDSCACILTGSRFYKYNTEFDPGEERLSDCPLVPIPSHGRCIDEREVQQLLAEMIPVASEIINSKAIIEWVAEHIPQCSTIIPASEEGEK